MQVSKETVIRTVVAALALVNTVLAMCGASQVVIDDATISAVYEGVSAVIAIATTVWAWWKNNSFTAPAITADAVGKLLAAGEGLAEAAKQVEQELAE